MQTTPLRVEAVDPITDPRWQRFAGAHADATIFHQPAWMALLRDHYGYVASAACVVGADGALRAGLPIATVASRLTGARLVALPFSDACPPLHDGDPDVQAGLANAVTDAVAAAGLGLEVRGAMPGVPGGQPVRRFVIHRLALPRDAQEAHTGFRPAIRRGIAKARRAGLLAEWHTDPRALDAFFRLHLQTRRRLGVPTQPRRFVRALGALFADGHGAVLLVRRQDDVLAAAVFLCASRTVTYKYGASDARHLDLRPNNLLFAEAIHWACERGYAVLDLGRTDLDNGGLRAFKRGWGAVESDLHYTYVGRSPPPPGEGPAHRLLRAAIRRGPTSVGRLVGGALYRHAG